MASAQSIGLRFRTILVPHDFSPSSEIALEYASELVDASEGVIHLLHVATPSSMIGPLEPALPTLMGRQLRDDRQAVESRLLGVGANSRVPVEIHVGIGTPATIICQVAEKLGADLIVMGTNARRGVAGVLQGSVAARTVRRAPCPVLTVRPHGTRAPG